MGGRRQEHKSKAPNELGASTGLYSQPKANGSKSQELSVPLWHRLSSWPLSEVSFVVLVSSSVRGMATTSRGHHIPEATFEEEALIGSHRVMCPLWWWWRWQGAANGSPKRTPHGVESSSSTEKGAASHEKSNKMLSSANHRGLPRGCFPEQFSYMKNEHAIITISCQSSGELSDSTKKCSEETGTWSLQ